MSEPELKNSEVPAEIERLPGDRNPGCLVLALVWVAGCVVFTLFTRVQLATSLIASIPLIMAVTQWTQSHTLLARNYTALNENHPVYDLIFQSGIKKSLKLYISTPEFSHAPIIKEKDGNVFLSHATFDHLEPSEVALLIEAECFEVETPKWLNVGFGFVAPGFLIMSLVLRSLNDFWTYVIGSFAIAVAIGLFSFMFFRTKRELINHFSIDNRAAKILEFQERVSRLSSPTDKPKDSVFDSIDKAIQRSSLKKAALVAQKENF